MICQVFLYNVIIEVEKKLEIFFTVIKIKLSVK
jgi:hypothetical protein